MWVPALGVKPIAHLLSDTIYHSTRVIYNTTEIPEFGYDLQLSIYENILYTNLK